MPMQTTGPEPGAREKLALRTLQIRVDSAKDIAAQFGGIDGAHHKNWVIDQMCRALLGEDYDFWVAGVKNGEDGPDTYDWDVGIAP